MNKDPLFMEELLNQANSKDSFYGTICQITSIYKE